MCAYFWTNGVRYIPSLQYILISLNIMNETEEKKQHFCWNVTWPVIWQTFLTKDGISGIGGCSLRRKQAGSVSCGTSFSGRNVGWLWDLRTRAGADIQCGMWGDQSLTRWNYRVLRYPWGSNCTGCTSTDDIWSLWVTALTPTVTWAAWTAGV